MRQAASVMPDVLCDVGAAAPALRDLTSPCCPAPTSQGCVAGEEGWGGEGGGVGGSGCNPPREFRFRLRDLMKPQCVVRTWSCEAGLLLQRDTQRGKSPTLVCVFCSPQRCIIPRLRPTNEIWNGGSRCKNPVPLLMLKYLKRG